MVNLNARCMVCIAFVMGFAHAASAADILIADTKSQPESLTVAPLGVLIVGSASTPFVYKVPSGSSTAEKFIDASAEGPGTFFFGMLSDASTRLVRCGKSTSCRRVLPLQSYSWSVNRFKGIDGITFLDGTLYVNNAISNHLYRIPVDASGKAGELVASTHILFRFRQLFFRYGYLLWRRLLIELNRKQAVVQLAYRERDLISEAF
jgi:hypothetical protein